MKVISNVTIFVMSSNVTKKCDYNFFRELEAKIDGQDKKVESLDKGLTTVSKKGAHCAYT